VKAVKWSLIGAVGVLSLFSGLGPNAYAAHVKNPKPPKVKVVHYKEKKNATPYDYLKAKKQKKPTGYYRSTLTGEMVYGNPPRRQSPVSEGHSIK
jgi:hypothetical protein